ncbi:LytTR family DNA-binding domain-containing protein [Emticicia sp. C21]|uniref:LytR/AlgR family response regulator transcription factor n=1 Tax=Emticicia sp. C21 TaxID=2302915 RepID=UPI000E351B31|nr:LytTR family DNA-binding domain-containing protein [Emticicia sp. C21]RFS18430.1 LytTR family transcriptional regulator [Emticicia sp. C21]
MNNELLITIDKHLTIRSSQILMLKADINYTHIVMEDGSSVLSSRTLGIFERRLFNQSFFRPNRSVIINLNYIVDFQQEASTIRMENDESITISRRRVKGFLKKSRNISYTNKDLSW